jgi:hypothetical protein
MLAAGTASAQPTRMLYDTIPFEIVQDKFIVEVRIDGKPAKLILDTGGLNIMVADSAEHYGVDILRRHAIADVNEAGIGVSVGAVRNLKIGRWMNWDVGKVTVVPGNPFFRELGVSGALGGEAFSNVCLVIDKRNRRLVASHPYRPPVIPRGTGAEMNMGNSFHAVVPVKFGSAEIDVLFDTGMSGFMSIGADDFETICAVEGNAELQHRGYGMLYVGVSGIKNALRDSVFKVNIPVMTLPGGKELRNVGSLTDKRSATIAGQGLFDYGVVALDYPRGQFYFLPYESGPSDVAALTRRWNVRILPTTDYRYEVVMTLGQTGLAIGDRVWKINGTELAGLPYAESSVEDLLGGDEVETAQIAVGPDKKRLKTITIRKI